MDDLTIYNSLENAYKNNLAQLIKSNESFSIRRRKCWNQTGKKVLLDNFIERCNNIGINPNLYNWAIELSKEFDQNTLYSD
jgi:hypothetical protein